MEPSIEIRRMVISDVDAVAHLYGEILDATYISFSELSEGKATGPDEVSDRASAIFREQLASGIPGSQPGWFVAAIGENIVGFVLASLHQAEARHIECWVDDVGVSHAWRRRGIATLLLRRALDWGVSEGVEYFLLESGRQNESAHRLFKHLGFKPLSMVFWRSTKE